MQLSCSHVKTDDACLLLYYFASFGHQKGNSWHSYYLRLPTNLWRMYTHVCGTSLCHCLAMSCCSVNVSLSIRKRGSWTYMCSTVDFNLLVSTTNTTDNIYHVTILYVVCSLCVSILSVIRLLCESLWRVSRCVWLLTLVSWLLVAVYDCIAQDL